MILSGGPTLLPNFNANVEHYFLLLILRLTYYFDPELLHHSLERNPQPQLNSPIILTQNKQALQSKFFLTAEGRNWQAF